MRTACPSASESSEVTWRFGRKRRLVLLLAWLTLWPTWTPLPVIAHFLAISKDLQPEREPPRAPGGRRARGAVSRPGRRAGQASRPRNPARRARAAAPGV